MSLLKSRSSRRFVRRSTRPATTPHFTKAERTFRSDMLSAAMNAPEADRRYAVYFSTLR